MISIADHVALAWPLAVITKPEIDELPGTRQLRAEKVAELGRGNAVVQAAGPMVSW